MQTPVFSRLGWQIFRFIPSFSLGTYFGMKYYNYEIENALIRKMYKDGLYVYPLRYDHPELVKSTRKLKNRSGPFSFFERIYTFQGKNNFHGTVRTDTNGMFFEEDYNIIVIGEDELKKPKEDIEITISREIKLVLGLVDSKSSTYSK